MLSTFFCDDEKWEVKSVTIINKQSSRPLPRLAIALVIVVAVAGHV